MVIALFLRYDQTLADVRAYVKGIITHIFDHIVDASDSVLSLLVTAHGPSEGKSGRCEVRHANMRLGRADFRVKLRNYGVGGHIACLRAGESLDNDRLVLTDRDD
jgi:hypothetical protein